MKKKKKEEERAKLCRFEKIVKESYVEKRNKKKRKLKRRKCYSPLDK